ncbi:MAG: DNA adenine methylase, partial [Methanomassiliicoccales archaeon]
MSKNASSFFRYPGGKSKLRDQIVSCLVEQLRSMRGYGIQYREPFFGGGSIGLQLLSRYSKGSGLFEDFSNNTGGFLCPIDSLWINDKDIGIACLWTSIIRYVDDFCIKVGECSPS